MKTLFGISLALFLLTSSCYGDLIHYYSFTLDASDSVGGANGTLLNGASVSGGTLNLDGLDDFVQFGSKIVPTSGSYSVAMFAQQTASLTATRELISQGLSSGPGFFLGHSGSGIIRASDSWTNTGVLFPSDGNFHHYALTVDSVAGNSKLYVDGSLRATLGVAITTTTLGTNTRLGSQFAGTLPEFFGGKLDEVRIYNRALSDAEVASIAAVPEPSGLVLCVTGLAYLLRRTRSKKQAVVEQ